MCHWKMLLILQSCILFQFGLSLSVCLPIGFEALAGENVTLTWSRLEDGDMCFVLIKEENIHTGIKIQYIIQLVFCSETVFFLHLYLVGGTDGEDSLL